MTLLSHISCHVVVISTKFGEFLYNHLGDSVTDGHTDSRKLSIVVQA